MPAPEPSTEVSQLTIDERLAKTGADQRRGGVLRSGQGTAGSPSRHDRPAGSNDAPGGWTDEPVARRGSAAAPEIGGPPGLATGAAAHPWPAWASAQLLGAVALSKTVPGHGRVLATELYRGWYNPVVCPALEFSRSWRPLVGTYRAAHAGSGTRILADGIALIDRHDAVGRDGWWRTWGDSWVPVDSRRHCIRVLFTPRPNTLGEFVAAVTAALLESMHPWLLACTTDLRRLSRSGSAVLYLPGADALPGTLLERLGPMLMPVTPPLCLPLAGGVALAEYPDNGMSFGEHRCRLVSLALQLPEARRTPLPAIADVFSMHGIDPAAPYRAARS
ncbi:MAG: T3SS effector HopA1 family protein [Pseudonocardiales bacterium]